MGRSFDHYMILTRTNPRKVLLLASEEGYIVPEWEPDSTTWVQLAARVTNAFASKTLGLRVTLLETGIGTLYKENGRRVKAYYLEGHDPTWKAPAGSLWLDATELENVKLAVPEMAPLLQQWLAGPSPSEPGSPPTPEWFQPGWYDEVVGWVRGKLAGQGVNMTGLAEQLKTWSISCLLRFPTDHGDYFFKGIPPVFHREPYFTEFLAEHYPGHIPVIAAFEDARGWMLMPDFQATNLREIDDITRWEEAARLYAGMQMDSTKLVGDLLERGCRDRRLESLGSQFAEVVADTSRLIPNKEAGLTPEELAKLNELVPVIQGIIAELDSFGLPATIIHGDLNTNNIALNESGSFIYYDWTDLSISHPFIDLDAYFEWGSPFEETIPDWEKRIRQAYLQAWTGFLPEEKLVRVMELSTPLAMLVQGLNYYWIVTRTDKSGSKDFGDSVPYYFRRLLDFLEKNPL